MANAWELYKQKNGGIAYRSDSAQEVKTSSKTKEETEEVKKESQESTKVKTMTPAKQEAQEKAGKSQENSIYQYTDSGTGGGSTNTDKKPNPLDVSSIKQEFGLPQLSAETKLSTDVMNSILTNIMERNKRASMLSEIEFMRNPQFSDKYGNDYENYLNNKPQKAIGFGSNGTTYVDESDADKYSFGENVRPAARKENIVTAAGKSVLAGMEGFNASVASAGEALARGLMSVERAVSGTDAFTGSLFKPVLDLSESRKEQKQALQEQAQKSWSGYGKAGTVANELIQGVTNAVPNAVLAIMSGGASSASTLAPQATGMLDTARIAVTRISQNPLYWSSFVPSFGSGFAEAKGQGATDEQAFMAAALSATANSVIEQSGGIETMPDDLSKMTAPKKALDVVKTALDEGKEELFQNPIERLVNKAVIGTDNPYFSVTDENAVLNPVTSAKEFAMGAAVGGLMRGGQTLFQSAINAGTKPENQTIVRESAQGAQSAVQETPQSYTAGIEKAVSEAPTAQDAAILQTFAQGTANNGKVNIDNAAVSDYYNTVNGGVLSGLDEETGRGLRTGRDGYGSDFAVQNRSENDGRGNLQFPGVVLLSDSSKNTLQQRGIVTVEMHDSSTDSAAFSLALDNARTADTKNGWAVTPKSQEELAVTKTYLAQNGAAGFAISNDGDIEAVFSNKSAGAPRGTLKSMMPQAIAAGGNKLDCYGEQLANLYARYGFIPVARVEFNPEYANPGWTPEKGTPYIYVMMHNGDSADTVVQNMGKYREYDINYLNALPTFDKDSYDNAMAYRDSLMQNRGVSPEDSTGAAPYGFDPLSNAANQYGAIPPGTNAARVVDIPRQMDADTKVSYTARTAAEAQATPDSFVPIIENETVKGRFSYVPVTNDATTAKAVQDIETNGYQESLRDWTAKARAGIANEDTVTTGALLYNNAVNAGDEKLALDILTDYQNLLRNAGRAVQAANILKKLAPQDRLYMIDKSIDKIIEQYNLPDGVTISEDLRQQYIAAKNEIERDNVISKMQQEVADQIQPTLMDKWTALRYINMLGNFKTQGRNIAGNVSQLILTIQKDEVAAAIESAVKLVNPDFEKTKSFTVSKELLRAGRADFESIQDIALGSSKYNDTEATGFMKGVEEKRRIFKFAPLEAYRKATNWAMEQGDVIFSKATYARSLAGWLKAHGITASQYTDEAWRSENRNTVDSAQSYAIKQAQEATYRDSNAFSNWVSKIGRRKDTPWYGRLISEGIMPFRRTPANVLLRAEEYSPLGFVNTAVKTIQMARGNPNISGADIVDSLAKSITGTGLLALGYGLSKGFLDDALEKLTDGAISSVKLVGKRDDEQDMLEGAQSYAIEVTDSDGTVHSYTIDWLSPSAIPMLMGAVMNEEIEDNGFQLSDIEGTLTSIADPLVQMSMLQGLNDTLSNIKYSENNLGQMVLNAGVSYLTQGLTNTLMGQIERTSEETRKTTYVDKDSEVPEWAQRLLGKASQKIPGWDYQQTDYIDAWGRTEPTGSIPQRAFSNFISPGYYSESTTTQVDDEIRRLEDITGENLTPNTAQKYITVDGAKKFLDSEQYVAYATAKGQTDLATRSALLQDDIYKNVPDNVKAKAMALSAQYADAFGKKAAGVGYSGEDEWISELDGKPEADVVRTIMEKAIDSVGIQNEPMARNLSRGIQQKKYSELPSEVTAQVQSYIDQYVKADQKKKYGFEDASDWVEKARELDTDQARLDFFTNKAIGETGVKLAKDRTGAVVNSYNDARFTGLSDDLKQKAAEYADNYFETTKREQYGASVDKWMKDADGLTDEQLADLFLSKAIENRTDDMPGNVYVNLNELYDNKEIGDDVLMTALAAGNETAFKKYTDYGEPAGLTPSEYIDLLSFANSDEAKSSKDEWGADIKGQTQKDKVLAWIDKQNVSDEKKEAMRLCLYDDASAEMRMLSEKYKGKEMTENEVLRSVSASVRTKYLDVAIPAKIPLTTYLEASAFAGEATSDKDENGKEIKGKGRQEKIIAYIAALDIDNKMKRALFNCFYESMKNCPW